MKFNLLIFLQISFALFPFSYGALTLTNLPATAYLKEFAAGNVNFIEVYQFTMSNTLSDSSYFRTRYIPGFYLDDEFGYYYYLGTGINSSVTPSIVVNVEAYDFNGNDAGPLALTIIIDQKPRSGSFPKNQSLLYTAEVKENIDPVHVIYTVDIVDPESLPMTFTQSWSPSKPSWITFDSASQEMRLTGPALNYETVSYKGPFTANMRATDRGGQFVDFSFQVTIVDDKDTPVISNLPNSVALPENHTEAQTIFTVVSSDEDAGDSVTLSLSRTIPSGGPFTITSAGLVKVQANPNFNHESVNQYQLEIVATDLTSLTQTKILYVNITDINESPNLTNLPENLVIYENYSSNYIFNVTAFDEDRDVLYYTLEEQSIEGFFSIDTLTGSIKLSTNSILDFETTQQYFLKVSVNDTAFKVTSNLTIQILNVNEKPIYVGTTTECSIKENTIGFLIQLNATDPENIGVLYEIENVYPHSNSFSVDNSGILTAIQNLNYEENSKYLVEIKIKDPQENFILLNISVGVEDVNERPYFTNAPAVINITEDTVNSTFIYSLIALDEDKDNLNFALLDSNMPFKLVSNGTLILTDNLDFENRRQYTLNVFTTDSNLMKISTLTINIIDVNEIPIFVNALPENITVNENFKGSILSAPASDQDFNDTLNYNLTTFPNTNLFFINQKGDITINGADYESTKFYDIQIKVTDIGGLRIVWNFTVHILDLPEPPSFTNLPFSVPCIPENLEVGNYFIYTANATDPENDNVTYSLISNTNKFDIENLNGTINLKPGVLLDYEQSNLSLILVKASDGVLSSTSTLTQPICNVNEPPTISNLPRTVRISRDTLGKKLLSGLFVEDQDFGENHIFTISSAYPSNQLNNFTVDSDGKVYAEAINDFLSSTLEEIILSISVRDGGGLTDTKNLTVSIFDNPQPPTIKTDKDLVEINELSAKNGSKVDIKIICEDINRGDVINMSIASVVNGSEGFFEINPKTGDILFLETVDFDDKNSPNFYTLEIACKDDTGMESRKNISISIYDHNDNAPKFPEKVYKINLKENTRANVTVMNFKAFDVDSGKYNIESFEILNKNISKYFDINSKGDLITKLPFDAEEFEYVKFSVKVTDTSGLTDFATAIVRILDENDHRPRMDRVFYNLEVNFRSDQNESFFVFNGSDLDRSEKGKSLSFKLKTESENFFLEKNGTLKVKKLARQHESFVLDVVAIDNSLQSMESLPGKVRVDSYDPKRHLTNFTLNIEKSKFLKDFADSFLKGLSKIFANSLIRIVYCDSKQKITPQTTRQKKSIVEQTVVVTLILLGTYTDEAENIESDKKFFTTNKVQAFTSKNGKPSANLTKGVLASLPFDGVTFYEKDDDSDSIWWIDDFWGRIVSGAIGFVLLMLMITLCLLCYFFVCRDKNRSKAAPFPDTNKKRNFDTNYINYEKENTKIALSSTKHLVVSPRGSIPMHKFGELTRVEEI